MLFNRRDFLKFSVFSGVSTWLTPGTARSENRPAINIKRLSDSHDDLKNVGVLGTVIIGSGYGGSVVAARLSERERDIAILERGKEWIPGEFPNKLPDLGANVRTDANPLGLLEFHFQDEMDVYVGSGLGGTSLINANVVLAPDTDLFERAPWPKDLLSDYKAGKIDGYFQKVRATLQSEPFPATQKLFRKAEVLKRDSEKQGVNFTPLDLTINFSRADGEPNASGVQQNQCRLCGDCITGCNYGAKNSLNLNYLPLAKKNGVKIFTRVEVDFISKGENGLYVVHYNIHLDSGERVKGSLEARRVIVSAGTMGSTKLLLKSQKMGNLKFSQNLGKRFSANGDFIAASYNSEERTNIQGFGTEDGSHEAVGPTLDFMADYRKRPNLEERIVVEEGAIPSGLVDIVRTSIQVGQAPKTSKKIWRAMADLFSRNKNGALNHTMLYLVNGHDEANGRLSLEDDKLRLEWKGVRNQKVFKFIEKAIRSHAKVNDGNFMVPNPRTIFQNKLMTVHPLGGCGMGDDVNTGVVDSLGRVFDPSSNNPLATYEGLFVADGSIIPTSLGVNPLLTISALSERIAEHIKL